MASLFGNSSTDARSISTSELCRLSYRAMPSSPRVMPVLSKGWIMGFKTMASHTLDRKSKGKRQKAKGKNEEVSLFHIFAFCLLPFAF
jgi:hypothetical protein